MKSETLLPPPAGAQDSRLRVLIADKSAHMRETMRRVLVQHRGCSVVGEAATLLEAVRLARASDADIALLDIDLILKETAPRLRRLADAFPKLHVVVMLNEESEDYRAAVAERWGYSCVAKDQAEIDLPHLLGARRRATA
jgi:DNA-binding NarL/FixJ family response regulator